MIFVMDYNGNSSICIFIVMVVDMVVLELICEDIMVQLDVNGIVEFIVVQVAIIFSDVCGLVIVNLDVIIFDCSVVGLQIVIVIVEDNVGNFS